MLSNDVLRRLRYILNYNDNKMVSVFAMGNLLIDSEKLLNLLKKEEDPGFLACTDRMLESFLNGLITEKRGKKEEPSSDKKIEKEALTNNLILKKLRIAFELREEEMLSILKKGGIEISSSELGGLFRKKGHKHFRPCGDQILRYFLKGLSV